MTDTPSEAPAEVLVTTLVEPSLEAPAQAAEPAPKGDQPKKAGRAQVAQPVLEKLFELYPHLFGAEFLPLKLGVFQELLASHPEHFARDTLKAALGTHTRSTRYLQSVAAGKQRHDLQGNAVEAVSPEHVYLALVELFSRRQGRSAVDLRPKLRAQVVAAFEASGLTREAYLDRVQVVDTQGGALLEDAFAEYDQALAKQEALRRAFNSSGQSIEAFADMYGLNPRDLDFLESTP
jgi:sRNA-binding protein